MLQGKRLSHPRLQLVAMRTALTRMTQTRRWGYTKSRARAAPVGPRRRPKAKGKTITMSRFCGYFMVLNLDGDGAIVPETIEAGVSPCFMVLFRRPRHFLSVRIQKNFSIPLPPFQTFLNRRAVKWFRLFIASLSVTRHSFVHACLLCHQKIYATMKCVWSFGVRHKGGCVCLRVVRVHAIESSCSAL